MLLSPFDAIVMLEPGPWKVLVRRTSQALDDGGRLPPLVSRLFMGSRPMLEEWTEMLGVLREARPRHPGGRKRLYARLVDGVDDAQEAKRAKAEYMRAYMRDYRSRLKAAGVSRLRSRT